MSQTDNTLRVAIVAPMRADSSYESLLGVMDFKDQVDHWRLVGQVHNPVLLFDDIDLDAVDGVIGFFREHRWADEVNAAGVPAVNFSNSVADLSLPRVGHDDYAIGRLGGKHLLERGFARFAFLGARGMWYAQRRLEGFRSVIEEEAGRPCEAHLGVDEMPSDAGDDPIRDWLVALPKPIGLMASSDTWGCQAIETATKFGLRVPDDIAVLGVDNDRWLTQIASTPMSSVEVNWRLVGYRAAELLNGLMTGATSPPPRWIPPVGVAPRRSTDIVVVEDPIVDQALKYIQQHCDHPITVQNLLNETGVSRRNLETRLKRAIGLTPYTAISTARIDRAKALLKTSDVKMAEIARTCGFNRPDQFFNMFKRLTGTTPGEYRKKSGVMRNL